MVKNGRLALALLILLLAPAEGNAVLFARGGSVSPRSFLGVAMSQLTFTVGMAGTVGAATATVSSGANSPTWAIKTSGVDNAGATCINYGADFSINSATGVVSNSSSAPAQSYPGFCAQATQAGLGNSPYAQAFTLVGSNPAGVTWYVTQAGSDTNPGTISSTFQHLAKGMSVPNPGDTVCINDDSIYSPATETDTGSGQYIMHVTRSGSAGLPITIKACNGHHPIIDRGLTNTTFYGIEAQANWIVIGDLAATPQAPNMAVYGESDQTTKSFCDSDCTTSSCTYFICWGVGVGIFGNHITVAGLDVHDHGQDGIEGSPNTFDGTTTFDYISIIKNRTHGNAKYGPGGGSGFKLYELTNADTLPGITCPGDTSGNLYHNCLIDNWSYNNAELRPELATGLIEDGNGCLVDDGQHTQQSGLGASYSGKTLVALNVYALNGGTGCHSYRTDHVYFVNNLAWNNVQTSNANTGCTAPCTIDGDLGNYYGLDVHFINNIVVPKDNVSYYSIFCASGETPSCLTSSGDYNDRFGGAGTGITGAHDLTIDPKLVLPTGDAAGNFNLNAGSPATGAGNPAYTFLADFYGRAPASPPQIGAATYAYQGPGDIVASGTAGFWGLRKWTAAYSGHVANIIRASDSTTRDVDALPSGLFDVATATTFCASTTCKVVTLYDQTGVCGSATQSTDANRPGLAFSGIGSLPVLSYSGAQSLSTPTCASPLFPWSDFGAFLSTGSNYQTLITGSTSNTGIYQNATQVMQFAGSDIAITGRAQNAWYAVEGAINDGTQTQLWANGATVSGNLSTSFTFPASLGNDPTSDPLTGKIFEAGLFSVALTPAQAVAIQNNSRALLGF